MIFDRYQYCNGMSVNDNDNKITPSGVLSCAANADAYAMKPHIYFSCGWLIFPCKRVLREPLYL